MFKNHDLVVEFIVQWIKSYANSANKQSLVIGISGGIDSALTSTLCAKTGLNTYVYNLPLLQKKEETSLSNLHGNWLKENFSKVELKEIDLTEGYNSSINIIDKDSVLKNTLNTANFKSRYRMSVLYYMAGLKNALVVGTGNKIEDFGVGFFTKYGDGGVDLSPIADLLKSEVYQLSKYLGISKDILDAEPTDGLWGETNRTDISQLGATYSELEWAMENIDKNKNSDFTDRQKEIIEIYTKLHRANKHKILPIPVCNIPKKFKDK